MIKTITKTVNRITYGLTITWSDLVAFSIGATGGYWLSVWLWR